MHKPDSIMLMITVEITAFLGLIGACMGSFIDAFSWRLHTHRNMVSDRSECEHCHHKLGPLDLIPIVSWLALRGKCRYCKAKISPVVPMTELSMTILFCVSYLYWPLGTATWQAIVLLVMWLLYLVFLGVLVVYDLRWMLLPDVIVCPLVVAGFVDAFLRLSVVSDATFAAYVLHVGYGILAIAGTYAALYAVSKGKWVGLGDVKLSIFIGAILGWEKALLALGLANLIGFIIVLPGLLTGKLTRTSRVPFGPFLIIAFIIAGLFGDALIHWYIHFVGL